MARYRVRQSRNRWQPQSPSDDDKLLRRKMRGGRDRGGMIEMADEAAVVRCALVMVQGTAEERGQEQCGERKRHQAKAMVHPLAIAIGHARQGQVHSPACEMFLPPARLHATAVQLT